jgi:mitogen-activated protein kinase organizer 1
VYAVQLHSYRGHVVGEYKIACCFSYDGGYVLSGSEDGDVYAWDLVDGQKTSFHAHGKPVRTIAAHPESAMIVTGCLNGSAKVFVNE